MALFLLALVVCVLVHLSAIAAAGAMLGVSVQQFSLGFGPTLFTRGRFRLGLIPSGGSVTFLDTTSTEVPDSEKHRALDQQPLIKKLAICLSGCVALAGLSVTLGGSAAFDEMAATPYQFASGALSPFDQAKSLISAASAFISSAGFLALLSVVAAKNCALNAMPLTALNGGDALAAIGRSTGLIRWWPRKATLLLFFVLLSAFISWGIGIASYAIAI
ncbi:site-2 protease family protein [Viridibacterium curvum]|uniref:Peptidase M50 domain-containing protein n=1 Tax=Viridibacterium curvum TaxID=1101404 RepID=A0ABP9R8N7_9RHOO